MKTPTHRRPRFFNEDQIIAYGRTLIDDQTLNELLDGLAVDALRALATTKANIDPMPQLHLLYKRADGCIEHQFSEIPIPDVDAKYDFFALVGHNLGNTAEHRLAAAYLISTVWISNTPGVLPQHAADRREAITVHGLAFDCLRHNLYTAHYQRDDAGTPRVTGEQTLHYGTEAAAKWTANKLLLALVRGFAKGVLEQVTAPTGRQH